MWVAFVFTHSLQLEVWATIRPGVNVFIPLILLLFTIILLLLAKFMSLKLKEIWGQNPNQHTDQTKRNFYTSLAWIKIQLLLCWEFWHNMSIFSFQFAWCFYNIFKFFRLHNAAYFYNIFIVQGVNSEVFLIF